MPPLVSYNSAHTQPFSLPLHATTGELHIYPYTATLTPSPCHHWCPTYLPIHSHSHSLSMPPLVSYISTHMQPLSLPLHATTSVLHIYPYAATLTPSPCHHWSPTYLPIRSHSYSFSMPAEHRRGNPGILTYYNVFQRHYRLPKLLSLVTRIWYGYSYFRMLPG